MSGALAGVKVIDFTRVLAGPLGSMILADMGADVIKIEDPAGGDLYRSSSSAHINGEGVNFLSANRNKKSLCLDVRQPEGYRILCRLIETADVFIENFRPGVTTKLRIDYDSLRQFNPRLVYGSITGFGTDGPLRDRAAVDPVIQAESGVMSLTGPENGEPVRIGTAIGDIYGALLIAQGIGFALYARERTGAGQKVELSLFDAAVFGLIPREGEYFATGTVPPRMGSGHPMFVPFQGFATRDGSIFVAAFHDALWRKFCAAIGLGELADHPDYRTNPDRCANRTALLAMLEPALKERSANEWIALLEPLGIPVGRINSLAEVVDHPQLAHNDMIVSVEHPVAGPIRLLKNPLRFSENAVEFYDPPPVLGQHSDQILAELGYDGAQIVDLRAKGVV